MIYQLNITLEILAFLIFSIGILPLPIKTENGIAKMPYLNRSICIMVAGMLFWFLAVTMASYGYNYCYVNQTVSNFATNTTISTGTCAAYTLESPELSYLNYGMGMLSIVLFILFSMLSLMQSKDARNNDGQY